MVIKPDDANSPTERDKINNRFSNTLLSRTAQESTPIVIIMQRLHGHDLCGFLMSGGTSDIYDWLNIPGLIRKETGSREWYQEEIKKFGYTHVKPILYDLKRTEFDEEGDSSFWEVRKTVKTLKGLREKDPYTFYSQYMGSPVGKGTQALDIGDIRYYSELVKNSIRYTFMTADTASTIETYSDPSVACFWGVSKNAELLLIDSIVGKWEVPELIIEMRKFWKKHNNFCYNNPTMTPTAMYMEDKSSGLFLNQQFLRDGSVTVRPVPRDGTSTNKKFTRFLNTIPYFKQGRILLPKDHENSPYMQRELLGQNQYKNTTGHDDFADNVSDAVAIAFAGNQMDYSGWS